MLEVPLTGIEEKPSSTYAALDAAVALSDQARWRSAKKITGRNMIAASKIVGTVDNPDQVERRVSVPGPVMILGGAAIGTYIGLNIGGGMGAAVGALVGAFVGALAAGMIKDFEAIVHPNGKVEVRYKVRGFRT